MFRRRGELRTAWAYSLRPSEMKVGFSRAVPKSLFFLSVSILQLPNPFHTHTTGISSTQQHAKPNTHLWVSGSEKGGMVGAACWFVFFFLGGRVAAGGQRWLSCACPRRNCLNFWREMGDAGARLSPSARQSCLGERANTSNIPEGSQVRTIASCQDSFRLYCSESD